MDRLGNVDWRLAGGLALGTAVGSSLGSNAAVQAPAGGCTPFQLARMLPPPGPHAPPAMYSRSTVKAQMIEVAGCLGAGTLEAAFTLGMLFLGRSTLRSARR